MSVVRTFSRDDRNEQRLMELLVAMTQVEDTGLPMTLERIAVRMHLGGAGKKSTAHHWLQKAVEAGYVNVLDQRAVTGRYGISPLGRYTLKEARGG